MPRCSRDDLRVGQQLAIAGDVGLGGRLVDQVVARTNRFVADGRLLDVDLFDRLTDVVVRGHDTDDPVRYVVTHDLESPVDLAVHETPHAFTGERDALHGGWVGPV